MTNNMADATRDTTLEKPEVAHIDPDVVIATQDRKEIVSASRTASPGFAQLVKNKRVLGYCKSAGHSLITPHNTFTYSLTSTRQACSSSSSP